MGIKWWRWVLLSLGCMLIIGGIAYGVTSKQFVVPVIEEQPDFSYDEVLAIVKNYLAKYKIANYSLVSSQNLTGHYVGKSKWSGTGKGILSAESISYEWEYPPKKGETLEELRRRLYGEPEPPSEPQTPTLVPRTHTDFLQISIEWNFYEKSQTVEILWK